MFWKKKPEKMITLKKYIEKSINGESFLGWIKSGAAQEFLNWLENLEYTLTVNVLNRATLSNDDLQFRRGEISTLKALRLKITEYRTAKPEPEETEENDNA
jgi:hypothetical protein